VCERLRPALRGRDDVMAVSGASAPENVVGALRAFHPDLVVVVDVARMGQPPGTLLRVDPSDPRAWGASTHTLPLPVFCRYLEETLGCKVTLLGIEPADLSFGEGLSPAVELAVERAASEALQALTAPAESGETVLADGGFQPHSLLPGKDSALRVGQGYEVGFVDPGRSGRSERYDDADPR
jgi:hydrogenase maturation protease